MLTDPIKGKYVLTKSRQKEGIGLKTLRLALIFLLSLGLVAGQASAEGDGAKGNSYRWIQGGTKVDLGTVATLDLGAPFVFLNGDDTRKLLKDSKDIPSGKEIGSIFPVNEQEQWEVILEYIDTGHIKDEEKKDLDADAILKSYREGTEEQNKQVPDENKLQVTGWDVKPFYDEKTHNLTWSIAAQNAQKEALVNYNVRMLTRTGYISVVLISDPAHRAKDQELLASQIIPKIAAKQGQRYEDFDASKDKVAEYGLSALILGGAGLAVAKKVGVLAMIALFLKKGWIIVVALLAGGWTWIKSRMGRSRRNDQPAPQETAAKDENASS